MSGVSPVTISNGNLSYDILLTKNCLIWMMYSSAKFQKASGHLLADITCRKGFLILGISSSHWFCHPEYVSDVDCDMRFCLTTLLHSPNSYSLALSLTNTFGTPYLRHTFSNTRCASAFDFIGLPATKPSDVTNNCAQVLPLADVLSLKKVSVYILLQKNGYLVAFVWF
jgi:hypothetical protein